MFCITVVLFYCKYVYVYMCIYFYSLTHCALSLSLHTYPYQHDELLSLILMEPAGMLPFLKDFHDILVSFNHLNFTLIHIIKYNYICTLFITITTNQLILSEHR